MPLDPAHTLAATPLYMSNPDLKRRQALLDTLGEASALTVSDALGFARSGGITGLLEDDGRMRFVIKETQNAARR